MLIVLAMTALLVGLGTAITGWWISSATGRRVEYLFATLHLWLGLLLIAGGVAALVRPKAVSIALLAAGLALVLVTVSLWKNARAIVGDDAYSRAKDGDGRIPLE